MPLTIKPKTYSQIPNLWYESGMVFVLLFCLGQAQEIQSAGPLDLKAIPAEFYISGRSDLQFGTPSTDEWLSDLDLTRNFLLLNYTFMAAETEDRILKIEHERGRVLIDLSGVAEVFKPPFVVNAGSFEITAIEVDLLSQDAVDQSPLLYRTRLTFADPYPITKIEVVSQEPLRVSDFEQIFSPLFTFKERADVTSALPTTKQHLYGSTFKAAYRKIQDRVAFGETAEMATLSVMAGGFYRARPSFVPPKDETRLGSSNLHITGESGLDLSPQPRALDLTSNRSRPAFFGLSLPF